VNALKFGRNGWATLVAPGDIDAVHTVHMSTTGTVTVWHRTEDGHRLTEVRPDESAPRCAASRLRACRPRRPGSFGPDQAQRRRAPEAVRCPAARAARFTP
jgi:hypothetical protein